MPLQFPTPASQNQIYTNASGKRWKFNGTIWNAINEGLQGTQGIQGIQGTQGAQGLQGIQGIQGIQGTQGTQGTQGIQGTQGTQGIQGIQGITGLAFTIAKTYVSVAALTADTAPTNIVSGQFALINTSNVEDADNSKLYLWNGSIYIFQNDLSGTAGIQGITGSTGAQGTQGTQGIQGLQGITGAQGITGSTGAQGTVGTTGSTGTTGATGGTGAQGTIGTSVTGAQGAQGTTGASILGTANTFTNTNAFSNSLWTNSSIDTTTLAGIITLYGTGNATTSQIMFKNTTGLGYGNHGAITGGYNTYFVMDTTDRGWIFRNATTAANVASISNTGVITATTFSGALSGNAATASSISGFNNPATGATANTIVYRDGSGHISGVYGFFNYLNMSHGASGTTTDSVFYSSHDDYIRKNNATGFRASLNVPTRTGGDASGSWGINVTGSSGSCSGNAATATTASSCSGNSATATSAVRITYADGPRNLTDRLPNTYTRTVNFDFVTAGYANGAGSYGGVMTWSPWDGTTASTGDSSYQLGVGNISGNNASGQPKLSIRNGIDSTWNAWYTVLHSGNYTSYSPSLTGSGASGSWGINVTGSSASCSGNSATATTLSGDSSNWASLRTQAVANMLSWKNYGNNHVIFDASNGTAPNGASINNTNANTAWTGTYPTLMGWNGSGTYGVRVDSARISDSTSGNASTASTASALVAGNNYTVNRLTPRASGISLGSGNSAQIEVNNAGSGACNISFHREGAYGAHFGLDTDNVFSTYGWSAGGGYTAMRVGGFAANGAITATGNITAYYSDERLKTKLGNIPNALNKVLSLNGFYFEANETAQALGYTKRKEVGVSAQEVEAILPEIIAPAPIDAQYKTLDYGKLVPLLIEAIKDLNAKVDSLQTQLNNK